MYSQGSKSLFPRRSLSFRIPGTSRFPYFFAIAITLLVPGLYSLPIAFHPPHASTDNCITPLLHSPCVTSYLRLWCKLWSLLHTKVSMYENSCCISVGRFVDPVENPISYKINSKCFNMAIMNVNTLAPPYLPSHLLAIFHAPNHNPTLQPHYTPCHFSV